MKGEGPDTHTHKKSDTKTRIHTLDDKGAKCFKDDENAEPIARISRALGGGRADQNSTLLPPGEAKLKEVHLSVLGCVPLFMLKRWNEKK